jgi:hypothetical protein
MSRWLVGIGLTLVLLGLLWPWLGQVGVMAEYASK